MPKEKPNKEEDEKREIERRARGGERGKKS